MVTLRYLGRILLNTALLFLVAAHAVGAQAQFKDVNFLKGYDKLYITIEGAEIPIEPEQRITWDHAGQKIIVRKLEQFAGGVNIDRPDTALQFVRFKTSPATWYIWSGFRDVEIVSTEAYKKLPSYGLRTYESLSSGLLGVISESDFEANHFALPVVETTPKGFAVSRWILTQSESGLQVELVKEDVSRDGKYKRTILKESSPPKLANGDFRFMIFK